MHGWHLQPESEPHQFFTSSCFRASRCVHIAPHPSQYRSLQTSEIRHGTKQQPTIFIGTVGEEPCCCQAVALPCMLRGVPASPGSLPGHVRSTGGVRQTKANTKHLTSILPLPVYSAVVLELSSRHKGPHKTEITSSGGCVFAPMSTLNLQNRQVQMQTLRACWCRTGCRRSGCRS